MTDDTKLTIDQLAQQVGMTVRNIRAHQSRGLLPPPELRGRTGYYGPEHAARIELIKDLQAEGFNLEAIKRVLERTPGATAAEMLSFTRAVAEPFTDEQPEMIEAREFIERWGEQLTPDVVARVERLGFARPLDETRWEMLSPRLERASQELASLGIPLSAGLDVMGTVKRHAESIAKAYVQLFLEQVWRPFEESGEQSEERWAEVSESLERLRPLAVESLVAIFQLVMTERVERTLEQEVARLGQPEPRRKRRGRR